MLKIDYVIKVLVIFVKALPEMVLVGKILSPQDVKKRA